MRAKMLPVGLMVLGVLGCGRAESRAPIKGSDAKGDGVMVSKKAWSVPIDPYVSTSDWANSVFEDDVVLITTSDAVIGIDAAAGQIRWTGRGEYVHPPGRARPLYRINDQAPGPATLSEIVEIDPRDGTELGHRKLETPVTSRTKASVFGSDRALIAIVDRKGTDELVAIDPVDGRIRWRSTADGAHLSRPVFFQDMLVVGTPYQAFALSDGRMLWTLPGECCDIGGTSDSAHVYVRASADPNTFVELDKNGHQVRTYDGRFLGATDTAFVIDTGISLRVMAHGGNTPVLEIPYPKNQAHSAVTLTADAIYYFDQAADKVWRRSLKDGSKLEVVTLTKHVGFSTERAEVLEPSLSEPPKVTKSRVYLLDHSSLRAFDIGTR